MSEHTSREPGEAVTWLPMWLWRILAFGAVALALVIGSVANINAGGDVGYSTKTVGSAPRGNESSPFNPVQPPLERTSSSA